MNNLFQFLQDNAFSINLNMNDTFFYATAQDTQVDINDLPKLLEVYEKFGHDGINAFASIIEEMDVIFPRINDKYNMALKYLEGYVFHSKNQCYKNYHYLFCKCLEEIPLFGSPIRYKWTNKQHENGALIVEAYVDSGLKAEGTCMADARKLLMEKINE